MRVDEIYKEYEIQYNQSSVLSALIKRKNSPLVLTTIPQATIEEGISVLKQRAYAVVNAEIEKVNNKSK